MKIRSSVVGRIALLLLWQLSSLSGKSADHVVKSLEPDRFQGVSSVALRWSGSHGATSGVLVASLACSDCEAMLRGVPVAARLVLVPMSARDADCLRVLLSFVAAHPPEEQEDALGVALQLAFCAIEANISNPSGFRAELLDRWRRRHGDQGAGFPDWAVAAAERRVETWRRMLRENGIAWTPTLLVPGEHR